MKRKTWKEDLKNLVGLEYILFKNVPMRSTIHGPVIDLEPGVLERIAAEAVIKHRVPIRGREVKFLRKALGFSMEKLASKLDLTAGAIFKWEKAENDRLHATNEIVVRTFVAEMLGIQLSGKYSELLGKTLPQGELILKAS